MTKRFTDEELAELERVCESRATRRAGDSFAYDADVVFGGLASLLAEVRELRAMLAQVDGDGVREPTTEDVQREAVRVYGKHTAVRAWEDGLSIQVGTVVLNEPLYAPTIAAAYAALRELPDYEGEK